MAAKLEPRIRPAAKKNVQPSRPRVRPRGTSARMRGRISKEAPPPPEPPDVLFPPEVTELVHPLLRKAMSTFFHALAEGEKHAAALARAHLDWRCISQLLTIPLIDAHYRAVRAYRDRVTAMKADDELEKRAFEGVPKALTHLGQVTGEVREYPHEALMDLARACAPDRHIPRLRQEISGPGGGAVPVNFVSGPDPVPIDDWEQRVQRVVRKEEKEKGAGT
jgi:hypothetical protein